MRPQRTDMLIQQIRDTQQICSTDLGQFHKMRLTLYIKRTNSLLRRTKCISMNALTAIKFGDTNALSVLENEIKSLCVVYSKINVNNDEIGKTEHNCTTFVSH